MNKIAIVYHYLAHYRLPVFRELMKVNNNEYHIISDKETTNGILGIKPELSTIDVENGGLRWTFVKNVWFKERFLWQKGLFKTIKKEDFDEIILLGNIYYISSWIAAIYFKLKKKKVSFWTHGVTSNEKGLKWSIRKLFYSLADNVYLYGENAKKIMIQNGFPKHKLKVIYNSLDYDKQIVLRKKLNDNLIKKTKKELFTSNLPLLVFVGRLTKQKKLDLIIKAVNSLKENGIRVNTLIIGKGPASDELKTLVNQLDLNNHFNFYGPCYDDEILSQLIGSADICISPGEIGLTAMTALGYGTPVISHSEFNYQMPEYEAIIPKFNGDLFKHNDLNDLTEKINSWIIFSSNTNRQKIQENCFKIIDEKYNPKNQVRLINFKN